jgi:hypothetical protein
MVHLHIGEDDVLGRLVPATRALPQRLQGHNHTCRAAMADKSPAAHKNLVVHAEFHAHPLTFLNRLLTELTTPLCGSMFPVKGRMNWKDKQVVRGDDPAKHQSFDLKNK